MKHKEKLHAMTQTAMLTAVMAVTAQLAVPLPAGVPLTLQTFGVALCAYLGGMKTGLPALLLYLAAGAAGMPVFANFRSGAAMLFGLTGGFLWGFVPMALLCACGATCGKKVPALLSGLCGLLLCHSGGVMQYAAVSGTGLPESFLLMSAPYFLKDVISLILAYFAAIAVQRALKAAGLYTK